MLIVILTLFKVIDNAPYHGRADVPKSSDKKDVMYKWLEKNWDRPEPIQPIKKYKKPELWQMVKERKKNQRVLRDRSNGG